MTSMIRIYVSIAFLACVFCSRFRTTTALNNRPIIGVLAEESPKLYRQFGDSIIHSDYVTFLEAGGARVVPIRINQPAEYYESLFKSINGVLFPGGSVSLSTSGYAKAGRIIFDMALKANRAGDYFPVLGICLGHQFLTVLVAGGNLLTTVDALNLPLPLDFKTPDYQRSKIYGSAPADIIEILQRENITDNDHRYGVKPKMFITNKRLAKFFSVLSTNRGRQGNEFVSTIEGRGFPVWGLQFHPEQTYNWNPVFAWPHTNHAVKTTQFFANFFVDQARRSNHTFPDEDAELNAMIENNRRIYIKSIPENHFESIYVFNTQNSY